MKTIIPALSLCILTATGCSKPQPPSASGAPVEKFPLADVRLLDSPFKHAQDKNIEYILAMDPDRLLAPYLREAGLEPEAESYGNWENTGLDGHIGGHYLTALSLAYAATGNREAKTRLDTMLDILQRAQRENGDGYLGGIPDGASMWRQIAAGEIDAGLFSLNEKWVPLYNIHKTYAGLRDAWLHTGSEQAREMLIELSDWGARLIAKLSDEQVQEMLRSEHGGLNEVYADVAEITGDRKYLEVARRLSHRQILQPLEEHRDALTGLHANTQIPKVIGYKRVGDLAGNSQWQDAAEYFWNQVVEERTVAIGGNSVREHFHELDDFSPMVEEVEGPETCNTYNMLKLTELLYRGDPEPRYVRYYERALYNHILSSQNPDTGGLVYFTPMRPQHYRIYSQPQKAMWCCVGSGIENHSKYGEMIYAHRGDELFVNLFIPSRLQWHETGLTLTQRNRFPDAENTALEIQGDAEATLHLRYPAWASEGEFRIRVNGEAVSHRAEAGSYVSIRRHWQNGDRIEIDLPMHAELEQMPDQSDYFALVYGPVVLAAKTEPFADEQLDFFADDSRMGHIASGPMCALESAPLFASEDHSFIRDLEPLPGDSLRFAAPEALRTEGQGALELIPFFRLHEARYMLYWPVTTPEKLAERRRTGTEADRARLALAEQTIDSVSPGEQQPESDHFFAGGDTEAGIHKGRHWRHASDWFSYRLRDPQREAQTLRITYYGLDDGREFDILLNGTKLADVSLEGDRGDEFFSVDYALPAALRDREDAALELRFEAEPGSVAGGIYGVRLLRE
ncbi:glycoside hydrolase family 127 protein [Microbulbifer halophilus]|uniref:Beta-L-arabinofuranosidase domain-containing protein n=1 Tax=Microbulbifer halophilus TaxID=453963 RepID=A0ABW5EBL9_9GAMM|nr:glycoside hydrolase family 127 protein [Microbulbifer halophilus]MCW8126592.1 glycoside hydrolase family 127 protein [Microbulbifer halophilus]